MHERVGHAPPVHRWCAPAAAAALGTMTAQAMYHQRGNPCAAVLFAQQLMRGWSTEGAAIQPHPGGHGNGFDPAD